MTNPTWLPAITAMDGNDPLRDMTVTADPATVIAARKALCQAIWATDTPSPCGVTNQVSGTGNGYKTGYFGVEPVSSTWFGFSLQSLPVFGAGSALWARTWFGKFSTNSDTLVVILGGHGEGFFNISGPGFLSEPGVDALAKSFAAKGCDILLSSMPLNGENSFATYTFGMSTVDPVTLHNTLGTDARFAPSQGSPIRYFTDPVLASINYLLSLKTYSRIVVPGLSGGAWLAALLAALDPRITHSFSVAGSVPLSARIPVPEGDWEQYALPLDYLDLYALSVAEVGRKARLLYHEDDVVCFPKEEVEPWAEALDQRLKAEQPGDFGYRIEAFQSVHDISPDERAYILDAINDASRD